MLRIPHLSDLHLTADDSAPANRNAWRLVHHIIEGYAEDENVVLITGDLTDNGQESERRALEALLLALKAAGFKVLGCAGNHDYALGGNIFLPESIVPFNKTIGVGTYPTIWRAKSEPLTFIGLDSADPGDAEWFAQGIVGKAQLALLSGILDETRLAGRKSLVYLHHHPFLRIKALEDLGMPLVDADALMERLEGRAECLLFGHRHVSELWREHHDVPYILASGRVTQADANGILRYRLLVMEHGEIAGVYTEEIGGGVCHA